MNLNQQIAGIDGWTRQTHFIEGGALLLREGKGKVVEHWHNPKGVCCGERGTRKGWAKPVDYLAPENLHELVRIVEEKGWEVQTDSWVDITGARQRMVIIYPNYSNTKLEKVAARSDKSLQKAYAEAVVKAGITLAKALETHEPAHD